MEWGKLFANLPDHVRVQAAEADGGAAWLLVESMCYLTRAESGGKIPHTQVEKFGGPKLKVRVAALVREGLWIKVDGGYIIEPDLWTEERNLSDSAEKKREADRNRNRVKRAAAKAAAEATGDGDSGANVSRDMSRDSSATDRATGDGDSRTVEKRREETTEPTADPVDHHQVADRRPSDDDDLDLPRIATEISFYVGRPVSLDEAHRAASTYLARADKAGRPAQNRTTYVLASLAKEPDVPGLILGTSPTLADLLADEARGLPNWCADPECNERTRMREKPDGTPYRCPDCGPKAATA